MVVWKYALLKAGENVLSLPAGATVVAVREQNENPTIWFMCDPDIPADEERTFFIVGTGHKFDSSNLKYLGMCMIMSGSIVVHVFEKL